MKGKIPETNTLLTHYKVEKTCTKELGFLFYALSYLLFQAHNRILFFESKCCVQLLVNYKICKFSEFL